MEWNKLSIIAFLQFIFGSFLAIQNFLNSKMIFAAAWTVVAGVGIIQAWKSRSSEPLQV